MSTASVPLPNWINYGLIPLLNLLVAFLISGFVVWLIGESPLAALSLLVEGAFGSGEVIGFTLFYTTSFIFTGLSVAVAIHAGLFNIGSEGQAYLGGLGCALVALALDKFVARDVTMPVAAIGAGLFGAVAASPNRLSIPLIFTALAGLFSERAGVFDIGLEGKMLGSAFAAACVA